MNWKHILKKHISIYWSFCIFKVTFKLKSIHTTIMFFSFRLYGNIHSFKCSNILNTVKIQHCKRSSCPESISSLCLQSVIWSVHCRGQQITGSSLSHHLSVPRYQQLILMQMGASYGLRNQSDNPAAWKLANCLVGSLGWIDI